MYVDPSVADLTLWVTSCRALGLVLLHTRQSRIARLTPSLRCTAYAKHTPGVSTTAPQVLWACWWQTLLAVRLAISPSSAATPRNHHLRRSPKLPSSRHPQTPFREVTSTNAQTTEACQPAPPHLPQHHPAPPLVTLSPGEATAVLSSMQLLGPRRVAMAKGPSTTGTADTVVLLPPRACTQETTVHRPCQVGCQ